MVVEREPGKDAFPPRFSDWLKIPLLIWFYYVYYLRAEQTGKLLS